jgi:hypothetical protein
MPALLACLVLGMIACCMSLCQVIVLHFYQFYGGPWDAARHADFMAQVGRCSCTSHELDLQAAAIMLPSKDPFVCLFNEILACIICMAWHS